MKGVISVFLTVATWLALLLGLLTLALPAFILGAYIAFVGDCFSFGSISYREYLRRRDK